jgi:hypothetical protein
MRHWKQSTFGEILCAIANLEPDEQAKLSTWFTSLACPGFRIHKRRNRYFVDHGDGRLIPVDGDPEVLESCKALVPFMRRLQHDLWMIPLTATRQRADEARHASETQLLHRLKRVRLRLRPYLKRSNQALNDAILRLRDTPLPNGEQRSWTQVRKDLKQINPSWSFPSNDTVRIRYMRLKKKQSPPGL